MPSARSHRHMGRNVECAKARTTPHFDVWKQERLLKKLALLDMLDHDALHFHVLVNSACQASGGVLRTCGGFQDLTADASVIRVDIERSQWGDFQFRS